MSDDLLLEVLARFDLPEVVGSGWVAIPHLKTNGFSATKIWQIRQVIPVLGQVGPATECDSALWCLRSWPIDEPGADTLGWIHQQVISAAAHCPFILAPVPLKGGSKAFVEYENRLWQVERWATGRNDFHDAPSPTRVTEGMQALAQLHLGWIATPQESSSILLGQWNAAGKPYATLGPSPGLQNRWIQLNQLLESKRTIFLQTRRFLSTTEGPLPGSHLMWNTVVDRVEQYWSDHFQRGRSLLDKRNSLILPLGPVLADVWSDHLFFVGDRLSAIIDYGAMRIDSAAADLSRCLSSLCGTDAQARQDAIQQYEAKRPLTESEHVAIQIFDHTSRLLGPLHWLRWLFVEQRMAPSEAILRRLQCLLEGQPF